MSDQQPNEERWCPTQSGTGSAWEPQWRRGSDEAWLRVPVREGSDPLGVPYPLIQRGVLQQIGLCGYEQAMALAWGWAALHASRGEGIAVRAAEYELRFEIKARALATEELTA